jgi:hypothetical protein
MSTFEVYSKRVYEHAGSWVRLFADPGVRGYVMLAVRILIRWDPVLRLCYFMRIHIMWKKAENTVS